MGGVSIYDFCPVGESAYHCWSVGHHIASSLGYLGMLVTSRKTHPLSQHLGTWAGIIATLGPEGISVCCSQEKWDKAKLYLTELLTCVESMDPLDRKHLESVQGFFIHLQCTYPAMMPFIKGFHLTTDGWRDGRDAEGWKLLKRKHEGGGYWDTARDQWVSIHHPEAAFLPSRVHPAPRLLSDLKCLTQLLSSPTPPIRYIHPRSMKIAIYGFVDASGAGFGSSFELPNKRILYHHGLWGQDADHVSSNYKELRNLVDAFEDGLQTGELLHTELFIFTDNSTAEGAFYKGNADSCLLFDLVLRLHQIDMSSSIKLHVTHIAGMQMIV